MTHASCTLQNHTQYHRFTAAASTCTRVHTLGLVARSNGSRASAGQCSSLVNAGTVIHVGRSAAGAAATANAPLFAPVALNAGETEGLFAGQAGLRAQLLARCLNLRTANNASHTRATTGCLLTCATRIQQKGNSMNCANKSESSFNHGIILMGLRFARMEHAWRRRRTLLRGGTSPWSSTT